MEFGEVYLLKKVSAKIVKNKGIQNNLETKQEQFHLVFT